MGPAKASPPVVRVLLVDDHPLMRSALRALVEAQPDMIVAGEAADGAEALARARELHPDVVLMDLSLPTVGGGEATERIVRTLPAVKVIALTAHDDRGYVERLLAAGASGYVLKRAGGEELVRAIRSVVEGGLYLDPSVASHAVRAARGATPAGASPPSEREVEVLRLVAEGHTMKEIAVRLGIGTRTVETHRERAMQKLGLETRAEVVRYAVQRGWLKGAS